MGGPLVLSTEPPSPEIAAEDTGLGARQTQIGMRALPVIARSLASDSAVL